MIIKDNSNYILQEILTTYPNIYKMLNNRTLDYLLKEKGIFIIPNSISHKSSLDLDNKIIDTINDKVFIRNTIGFIGGKGEKLEIKSRFSSDDSNYFLFYMLEKVFDINIVNLNTTLSFDEQLYLFLIYLFPRYLKLSLRKGLYKEYKDIKYNDLDLKGNIDIVRHIKINIPFIGKIAYSDREFKYDNMMTQLIRHTVEHIREHYSNSEEILSLSRSNIDQVLKNTPSFKRGRKREVISYNVKYPVRHSFYAEYLDLQKLCLLILSHSSNSLTGNNEQIHGILFDVSWLWEEYLNTLLKNDFKHSNNRTNKKGIPVYEQMYLNDEKKSKYQNRTVFPDYYSKDNFTVIDAKYKFLGESIARLDLQQIVLYAHILKYNKAGFLYPSMLKTRLEMIGQLKGYKVDIFRQSLNIPQESTSYKMFKADIRKEEVIMIRKLKEY